ncbi:hypothetical protein GIB67_005085 [Kingdonia uniflora]|uniref:non-specific serine/threonine protein kinase n=1 Tax=Kingdonia uniflora TaxID=39325 RepID=A0A7J7KUP1_9MAGN|nr:hypothetical protein GIB67_005085 [Kingdonia uniflora]
MSKKLIARILSDTGFEYATEVLMEKICHRDLKLENTLFDGSTAPRPKIFICVAFSTQINSRNTDYIAPEVLSKKEYDGKVADVWSCGVTLYVMLVGVYPFEDPKDPRNFRKMIGVHYSIPYYVQISMEYRQLLSWIFVGNPEKSSDISNLSQSIEYILAIVREAGKLVEGATFGGNIIRSSMDLDDLDDDVDLDDVEAIGDFVCAL